MASSQHTSRRWSGCPMCKYYKFRDHGQAVRQPWAVQRKVGKKRRLSRKDLGDFAE